MSADARPGGGDDGVDILHLDLDCFFAAVEVLEDPALRGRPVIVGGLGPRGVVASASYEARVHGVRSAMAMGQARALCPRAAFLQPRHALYAERSRALHELLADVTPVVEPISLDEAFLDVSGAHRLLGRSVAIATQLRARVASELSLDCAVGVASTKLVAKLASKAAKPRIGPGGVTPGPGVLEILDGEALGFLHAHPVRALPGVGSKTAAHLARFGVSSVGDLALVSRDSLVRLLGTAHGSDLFDLAHGRDPRRVTSTRDVRSIGHEETFSVDLRDRDELLAALRPMAVSVAARSRKAGLAGRTVTLKARYADFSTVTRSRSFARPLTTAQSIGDAARALLEGISYGRGIRLLGVHLSQLASANDQPPDQLELFPAAPEPRLLPSCGAEQPTSTSLGAPRRADADRERLEAALDAVRERFGDGAIGT